MRLPSSAGLLLLCAIASQAFAEEPLDAVVEQAKLHHRAGESLYLLGRYSEALREFQAGYALTPRPEFLLNLGQVYRKLGDPRAAIGMFEKFLLSTTEGDPRRSAVADVLKQLHTEASAQASAAPPAPPTPSVATEVRVAAPAPPRRRWYRDWLGGTLGGIGLAGIAVGAGLFAQANGTIGDSQLDIDHYARAKDAVPQRTAGVVVLAVGGALVLGSIIRYATHRR